MEIKGKVHCFFEQSGTFKNEFIKLGYQAEDYDIQNNFGQTDNVIDLFSEIDTDFEQNRTEQNKRATIFDSMSSNDLIVAFYPCIYFRSLYGSFLDPTDTRLKNGEQWIYLCMQSFFMLKQAMQRFQSSGTRFARSMQQMFMPGMLRPILMRRLS